jgi:hypothetical protein
MVTRYSTVDEYLADLEPGRLAQVQQLRTIVLAARPGVVEHIKWNSPSYVVDGVDRATMSGHGVLRLVLHAGVDIAEDKKARPTFDGDPDGLLEWHSNIRASIAFADLDAVTGRRDAVGAVVARWLDADFGA